MPKWLSYLMIVPGLIMAIQIAFGWEEGTLENTGVSWILVTIGMVLMGMSQVEKLQTSEHREEAREAEIRFAFVRMAATGLIALTMLGFSFIIAHTTEVGGRAWLFLFSLPFFFSLLTIKYYQVWHVVRFLYGTGIAAEGEITEVEQQIHHKRGSHYLKVTYRFTVPEKGSFSGESISPYSPYITYTKGDAASVLYDPKNPTRNLLMNAWHGKGLHSKLEYDKKLSRPDEG